MARETTEDIAKGIGILLVVAGHAVRGLLEGNYGVASPAWKAVNFMIYTTHMPMFFFLAGINARSLNEGRGYRYAVDRTVSILRPYLVWSLLLWGVRFIYQMAFHVNHPVSVQDLIVALWNPKDILWFLWALLWMQVLVILLKQYTWVLFIAYAAHEFFLRIPPSEFAGQFAVHLPFFVAGHLTGRRYTASLNVGPVAVLATACAFFALGLYEFYDWTPKPVGLYTLPVSVMGVWLLIVVSSKLQRLDYSKWLDLLGRRSLAIYLLHVMPLAMAFRMLQISGVHNEIGMIVIATIFSVGFSLLLLEIFKRLKVSVWLGLEPRSTHAPSGVAPHR